MLSEVTQSKQSDVLSSLVVRNSRPIILLVEDVKSTLESLYTQVSNHFGGLFQIEAAESGEDALELLKEFKDDGKEVAVIVCDQSMPPGQNGDSVLIESHQLFPRAKKIMLTGQASVNDVANVINNAKLYRYIAKPWEELDLKLTISSAVSNYIQSIDLEEQNRILKLLHQGTQIISTKLDYEHLLRELMLNMLEFSKAEKAIFVLKKGEDLFVEASCSNVGEVLVKQNLPLADSMDYPYSLIVEVGRTQNIIVLENACEHGAYTDIPYFNLKKIRSVLIVPVLNMGKLTGIFYLENNSIYGVFNRIRIEIIDILASAAAIAIENTFLYEKTEELVIRRNKQLFEAYNNLIAVNSHKDEMIRIVSHDIRSPLTGIAELAGTLKDPDIASNHKQVINAAEIIQRNITSVIKLADDILDLAKLESGKILLVKQSFELDAFFHALIQNHDILAKNKGLKLSYHSSGPTIINADQTKLTQAFNNLISNSIKFTSSGGIVTVAVEKLIDSGTPIAKITVSDTGIGIAPEDIPHLFDKFGKHQRAGTKGEKGTGLGMSIAKQIIELHSGSINVVSQVNKGTTFTITLPLE